MKKNQILLFTIILALVAITLSVFLIYRIIEPIQEKAEIEAVEKQIVEKLKFIRSAQKLHLDTKGVYATNFKELAKFIEKDNIYIINRNEKYVTGDSSYFEIDTVGTVPVKDSLLTGDYKDFKASEMGYIPGKPKKLKVGTEEVDLFFNMEVTVRKAVSGDVVYAIQVTDVLPYANPRRKEPLKFGSIDDISTRGNWEY